MIYHTLLFIGIFLGAIAQLSIKKGAVRDIKLRIGKKVFKDIFDIYWNKYIIFGTICYGIATILWVAILSKLDLSYAYPIISTNFVIITILSKVVFKERITKLRWLSVIVIALGVILTSLS